MIKDEENENQSFSAYSGVEFSFADNINNP
jgi:hypothetical protein